MKRMMIVLLLCMLCSYFAAAAENPYNTGWTESFNRIVCVSGRYTYIATGGWDDPEGSWGPEWYSVAVVDNETAQITTLRDKIYGSVHMAPYGDGALLIDQKMTDKEGRYNTTIRRIKNGSYDPETVYADTTGVGYIQDLVLHGGELILITSNNVYAVGLDSLRKKTIFSTERELLNTSEYNRAFVLDDRLIISDGRGRILSVDPESGACDILADDYCADERSVKRGEVYGYVILSGKLYYYDVNRSATVVRDLKTGEKEFFMDEKTGFYPVSGRRVNVKIYADEKAAASGNAAESRTVVFDVDEQGALRERKQ